MTRQIAGLAFLAFVTMDGIAAGQSTVQDFRDIAAKIVTESKILPLLRDASGQGSQNSPEPSLSFLSSNDGTTAKARFGYLVSDATSLDVVFSGPIRGGTATFADRSGLGKGVSAEGELTLVLSQKKSGTATATAEQRAPLTQLGLGQLRIASANAAAISFDDLVNASLMAGVAIQQAGGARVVKAALRGAPQALLALPTVAAASTRAPDALAQELGTPDGREAFAAVFRLLANDLNLWRVEQAWLLTLSGSAGRSAFTVADLEKLTFQQVQKDGHSANVALGTVITRKNAAASQGFYFGGSYEWGTGFSGSPKNTCLPAGTAGATICQNAVSAEPQPASFGLLQGDARWYVKDLSVALTARPSYERKSRETTLAFPIYFLQNSKDLQSALKDAKAGLNGGVNFGWRKTPAHRADFFALFFVGTLFNLPGVPR